MIKNIFYTYSHIEKLIGVRVIVLFFSLLISSSILKGQYLYDDFIGKSKSYLIKEKGEPIDDMQFPKVESLYYKEARGTVMTFIINKSTNKIQTGLLMIGSLSDREARNEKDNYRRALQKRGFVVEGFDKFGAMLMTKGKREAHIGIVEDKDGTNSLNIFFN